MSSRYLDYPNFVAFFYANGFATWRDHVVRYEHELPSLDAYNQWLTEVRAQETSEQTVHVPALKTDQGKVATENWIPPSWNSGGSVPHNHDDRYSLLNHTHPEPLIIDGGLL
jgi:hypothetical protein